MSKSEEIEVFGPLTKQEERVFDSWNVIREKIDQIIVFFKKNDKDFRIKWDKNRDYFEFIHKSKNGLQRNIRQENLIKIRKDEVKQFLSILEGLGFDNGLVSKVTRIDFEHDNIIWSLKYGSGIGDYWEAEASQNFINKHQHSGVALDSLLKYIKDIGLKTWTPEEFRQIRKEGWSDKNPVSINSLLEILE